MMQLPDIPRAMMDGLISRGETAAAFSDLWTMPALYEKHLQRRIRRGEVSSADDYARKTLAVIASATTLTVATPSDAAMRHTGKMALKAVGWVVLVAEDGRLVTAYPVMPELPSFEENHRKNGDRIDVYQLTPDYRARLAHVFGGRK